MKIGDVSKINVEFVPLVFSTVNIEIELIEFLRR